MKYFILIFYLTCFKVGYSQLNFLNIDSCFNTLDSLDQKTGFWKESISSTSFSINCYSSGLLNGTCYKYRLNQLSEKADYQFGIKNGVSILFNFDGYPLEISNYKNGKLSGIRFYFYEDHSLRTIIHFENDLYHGTFEAFNPNGSISVKQEYYEGQLNGDQILYWPNGNIKSISNYINGIQIGEFKYFEENGNLIK